MRLWLRQQLLANWRTAKPNMSDNRQSQLNEWPASKFCQIYLAIFYSFLHFVVVIVLFCLLSGTDVFSLLPKAPNLIIYKQCFYCQHSCSSVKNIKFIGCKENVWSKWLQVCMHYGSLSLHPNWSSCSLNYSIYYRYIPRSCYCLSVCWPSHRRTCSM